MIKHIQLSHPPRFYLAISLPVFIFLITHHKLSDLDIFTDSSNVPILGAVVYGTKDELKSLIGNSHIKAASFGVVVDKY